MLRVTPAVAFRRPFIKLPVYHICTYYDMNDEVNLLRPQGRLGSLLANRFASVDSVVGRDKAK